MKKNDYDIDYKKICPEISEEIEDYLKKNDAMMKYREYERKRTKYINDIIVYAKEDSVERLIEAGVQLFTSNCLEDDAIKSALFEQVMSIIDKFDKVDKRIVELIFIENLTERKAAKLIGISHQAIHKRKAKIKNFIKEKINL